MAASTDMLWPAIGAQIFSTVLSAGGQFAKGNAQQVIGQRTNQADQFQAAQLVQNAGQEQAAGEVAAENQNLATSYIVSQALARAAASGGGASDPTVINNIARIQGAGANRANVARYQGDTQARAMLMQADAKRMEGETAASDGTFAKNQSQLAGFSTVLSGAAKTMFGKYGVFD